MYEISVLTVELLRHKLLLILLYSASHKAMNNKGGNPGSNRELAMPQIAALPIEL